VVAQIGLTPSYLRESGRGMAAVQQNISRVLELREKVLRFAHDMINVENGEIAASCELTAVHLDRAARGSIAFEDKIQALAQKLMG